MPSPSNPIGSAIEQAREWLATHPDEARYTDSPATATVVNGLECRVSGPDGASLATAMPPSVGGSGAAPSPGWFLRAAEASCLATLIAMRAAWTGRPLSRLSVTVDSVSDDRGILAVDDAIPAGPLSTHLVVRGAGIDAQTLGELAGWALSHCPVTEAVQRAVPMQLDVEPA